jgi:hypothetical protein
METMPKVNKLPKLLEGEYTTVTFSEEGVEAAFKTTIKAGFLGCLQPNPRDEEASLD